MTSLALPKCAGATCVFALCGALALAGCGKKSGHTNDELAEDDGRGAQYDPDPAEVPLTADFEKAASRRVRADNYRDELARIERELKLDEKLK